MYKHTQIGWLMIILFGIAIFINGVLGICYLGWFAIVPIIAFAICLSLFISLTVIVDDDSIEIKFGIGLIRKRFGIEMVELCRAVKNNWWYGWGIRKGSKMRLFNVSGLDAVELSMKDGKIYRIGTDEPEKLSEFIEKKINRADCHE